MGIGSMASLYLGVSGLQVNQTALNTTAHNLSNLDTDGYSRQQILMRDSIYKTYSQGAVNAMQTGLGTSMEKIRQVRDEFADQQYRLETGRQAFYESAYGVVEEVEKYFGTDVDNEQLKNAMTTFWSAMNQLQTSPGDITYREAFIETAQEVVDQAKLIYNQITFYQENLNNKIQKQVEDINKIGETIHDLNVQIVMIESNGVESANDLRDKRNALLDELATYADISYKEREDGSVSVSLEGASFVTEDRIFKLGTLPVSGANKLLTVVWKEHGNMPLYNFDRVPDASNMTDIGSLQGLLFARGDKIGNYTLMGEDSIDWASYKNRDGSQMYQSLEEFYAGEGYRDYGDYYAKKIEPSLVTNLETQLDFLLHNIVTTVNDVLCPNTKLTSSMTVQDKNGQNVTIAAGTTILDTDNAPIGLGDNGQPGVELFSRRSKERYTEYTYQDANGKTQKLYVYNEEDINDPYSQYTIDQLIVNEDVIKNPSLIPLSNKDHSVAQETVNHLLDAWSGEGDYTDNVKTLTPDTLSKYNLQAYYNAMIADLANKGNSYYNIAQNQQMVANQLDNQRQLVAGVSSDEELSNMIMFQQAYNAASRYINTVADMLDTLINRL